MKYKLTTSISAKCRLLTSKVNFVVTIAYCYALRATYFITQRAEAHLLGATQSFPKKGKLIIESSFIPLCTPLKDKYLCALCSLRKNLEPSWMVWIEVYDYCKSTCKKADTYIHNLERGKIFSARDKTTVKPQDRITVKV